MVKIDPVSDNFGKYLEPSFLAPETLGQIQGALRNKNWK